MAMVLDVSTAADRGRLTGLYNTWMLVGLALGPLVGGVLVDLFDFRAGLLACAGIAAIGLAVALGALPETARPVARNAHPDPRSPVVGLRRRMCTAWQEQVGAILRADLRLLVVAGLFLITQLAGEGVVFSTVSLLLQQRLGTAVPVGSLVLGVASASGVLLALRSLLAGAVGPLAGHLSDLWGNRWPVIAGSLVLGMAGFGLLSFATSLGIILLGIVLSAVSGGAALATLAAQVGDLTPPGSEGVVMGAYATAGDVGSMAGPFLAFALLSVADLRWAYLLCTFAFMAGLWLIWRLQTDPDTGSANLLAS
jgi:MFS family permease